jgi:hypothetical protein
LGPVTGITVAPGQGGAEIMVAAPPAVEIRHFRLAGPSRIVVDLAGSALAVAGGYDGLARGPVRNVRLSQYRRDTVRLVIDLDSARSYRVDRAQGLVRVVVTAPAAAFPRWGIASGAAAPKAAEALKLSAAHLEALGVVDEVVPEPTGGAHQDPAQTAQAVKYALQKHLNDLRGLTAEQLRDSRYERFRRLGVYEEAGVVRS